VCVCAIESTYKNTLRAQLVLKSNVLLTSTMPTRIVSPH